MQVYLKVKICSLAAEAKIIRRHEHIYKPRIASGDTTYFSLHVHRIWNVRSEARCAQLAYGYLRGRRYRQLEAKCHDEPDWARTGTLVEKYGHLDRATVKAALKSWAEDDSPGLQLAA